jgi:hypothetical protein
VFTDIHYGKKDFINFIYMGNGTSALAHGETAMKNLSRQAELLKSIQSAAGELMQRYKTQFLDPGFCERVSMIYADRLQNFRKQEVNGVAYLLGLMTDDKPSKGVVCARIIEHYSSRLQLVAAIEESLGFCSNRIYGLVTGPRCEGNPEIFNQEECSKSRGRWLPTVVMPDGSMEENAGWFKVVFTMQDRYLSTLTRLYDILTSLKNFEEDIDEPALQKMASDVSSMIDVMQETCGQLYKMALTTPTFTPSEKRLRQEAQALRQQEQAAKKAALRSVRGLQAVAAQK